MGSEKDNFSLGTKLCCLCSKGEKTLFAVSEDGEPSCMLMIRGFFVNVLLVNYNNIYKRLCLTVD